MNTALQNNQSLGHGIYPDHEIIPNLQDKIEGKDPEVQWIINDIKSVPQP
jgi:hypothetical protein